MWQVGRPDGTTAAISSSREDAVPKFSTGCVLGELVFEISFILLLQASKDCPESITVRQDRSLRIRLGSVGRMELITCL